MRRSGRAKRPKDVGVLVKRAQVRTVGRLLVARRLELVELLHGFLVDREDRAEVSGRVDRVRRPARDLRDRLGLLGADLRRTGGELFVRQSFRSAAARPSRRVSRHRLVGGFDASIHHAERDASRIDG